MAARIISVTFETETQGRWGAFSVPKSAANLLGIHDDDPAELRVTWEGGLLELSTHLRSGLEVDPGSSDETTSGLESIPPRTPITVTVWRTGEGQDADTVTFDHGSDLGRQGPSGLQRQYQRFFTRLLKRFKELRPGSTNRQRVSTDNWLDFSAGRSGVLFTWSTAHTKYLRVELYFDTPQQAENKRMFDRLKARAEELESQIGEPISWERLDHRKASRLAIYSRTPTESFDTDEELIEWAAQTMARVVDVLKPVVRTL